MYFKYLEDQYLDTKKKSSVALMSFTLVKVLIINHEYSVQGTFWRGSLIERLFSKHYLNLFFFLKRFSWTLIWQFLNSKFQNLAIAKWLNKTFLEHICHGSVMMIFTWQYYWIMALFDSSGAWTCSSAHECVFLSVFDQQGRRGAGRERRSTRLWTGLTRVWRVTNAVAHRVKPLRKQLFKSCSTCTGFCLRYHSNNTGEAA